MIGKPTAGMSAITEDGKVIYSMKAKDFARHMGRLIRAGADISGGCCGTTPEYIRALYEIMNG